MVTAGDPPMDPPTSHPATTSAPPPGSLPPGSQEAAPSFQPRQGTMVAGHVQAPGDTPSGGPSLVEMLNRIDELDSIPRLQVHAQSSLARGQGGVAAPAQSVEIAAATSIAGNHVTEVPSSMQATTTTIATPSELGNLAVSKLPRHLIVQLPSEVTMATGAEQRKAKVGRPRVKPPKERKEWHYHLGGVRHCRVPLSADLKEVLEVAYVSKIMAKNFRKEGQPEKERIAHITGMNLEKVQEWFKNRRKKDRLQRDTPQKRGRKPSSFGGGVAEQTPDSSPSAEPMHVSMEINPSIQVSQIVHVEVTAANTPTHVP